jgi:hypothetical protein
LSRRRLAGLMASVCLIPPARADASVINARSVSLKDVTSAVASAAGGDTVMIPAGIATWTGRLTINKAITLQGSGIGNTIIRDAIQDRSIRLMTFVLVAGKSSRLTGIEFQNAGMVSPQNGIFLSVNGQDQRNGQTMRIDHCKFDNLLGKIDVDTAIGVADHNAFISSNAGFFHFHAKRWNGSTDSFGDASWFSPINWGTAEFFFLEDNTFLGSARSFTDGDSGCRFVVRHNTITDGFVSNHGTETTGRARSALAMEVYNNKFILSAKAMTTYVGSRGGVLIVHDNDLTNWPDTTKCILGCFRTHGNFQPWLGANGQNPWDKNRPGGPFYSGTTSIASSGLTVTVSGNPGWSMDQWKGYVVKRTTNLGSKQDAGFAEIKSSTSNTLTYCDGGAHTNNLSFAAGDSLQLWKVDLALDQPGVSGGSLVKGHTPVVPAGWNDQVVTPCYSWNNTNAHGVAITMGAQYGSDVIVPGVHYFNDTPMPGYTPYAYPHPLTKGLPPSKQMTRNAMGSSQHNPLKTRQPWGGKKLDRKKAKKAKEKWPNEMAQPDQ